MKDAAVPSFGSNIRTMVKAGRKGKGGPAGSAGRDAPKGPAFERVVANCLCCGKIYNHRVVTNDLLEFLGEVLNVDALDCAALKAARSTAIASSDDLLQVLDEVLNA